MPNNKDDFKSPIDNSGNKELCKQLDNPASVDQKNSTVVPSPIGRLNRYLHSIKIYFETFGMLVLGLLAAFLAWQANRIANTQVEMSKQRYLHDDKMIQLQLPPNLILQLDTIIDKDLNNIQFIYKLYNHGGPILNIRGKLLNVADIWFDSCDGEPSSFIRKSEIVSYTHPQNQIIISRRHYSEPSVTPFQKDSDDLIMVLKIFGNRKIPGNADSVFQTMIDKKKGYCGGIELIDVLFSVWYDDISGEEHRIAYSFTKNHPFEYIDRGYWDSVAVNERQIYLNPLSNQYKLESANWIIDLLDSMINIR